LGSKGTNTSSCKGKNKKEPIFDPSTEEGEFASFEFFFPFMNRYVPFPLNIFIFPMFLSILYYHNQLLLISLKKKKQSFAPVFFNPPVTPLQIKHLGKLFSLFFCCKNWHSK